MLFAPQLTVPVVLLHQRFHQMWMATWIQAPAQLMYAPAQLMFKSMMMHH
jgi:hypothetical protein